MRRVRMDRKEGEKWRLKQTDFSENVYNLLKGNIYKLDELKIDFKKGYISGWIHGEKKNDPNCVCLLILINKIQSIKFYTDYSEGREYKVVDIDGEELWFGNENEKDAHYFNLNLKQHILKEQ